MRRARRRIEIGRSAMESNDAVAVGNRAEFERLGLFAVNLVSSPGAGKTTLLEALARMLGDSMVVIEGDVKTSRDADRVRAAGVPAWQIETGGACHLDAAMVARALAAMRLEPGRHRLLVIENVGNLICPSSYDLGEHVMAGLLSIPEGDDKVLKYPAVFSRIDLMILGKTDLSDRLPFDMDRAEGECRSLNPDVQTVRLSALSGDGVGELVERLERLRSERFGRLRGRLDAGHLPS